jgi:hypothetical protein
VKFLEPIFCNPVWKTVFQAVLPIVAGIFSGTFTAEITTPAGLDWGGTHKTYSLYVLIFLIGVIYLYHKTLYRREVDVLSFSDDEYCVAYMRSKCLPAAAQKYRDMIENGSGDELNKLMKQFKKSLE